MGKFLDTIVTCDESCGCTASFQSQIKQACNGNIQSHHGRPKPHFHVKFLLIHTELFNSIFSLDRELSLLKVLYYDFKRESENIY